MKKTFIILFLITYLSCTDQYNLNEGSFKLNELKEKSYKSLSQNDSILFFKYNKEYLLYAQKHRDSTSIADSYWNYAIYYNKKEANDSAYKYFLNSYKLFEQQNNLSAMTRQLYDIAKIKGRIRDYTGAEKLLYQSLENTSDKDLEILIRNYLGIIYKNLNEFKDAFENYNIALELIEENDQYNYLKKTVFNNLGMLLQKQKNYEKSLDYFYKSLDETDEADINRLARYNTNILHTKLLMGNTSIDIENGLIFYLNKRIDQNIPTDIFDSYYILAKYYQAVNNKEMSLFNATKALKLSTRHNMTRDELKATLLLADISSKNAINYYKASIELKDSLELIDRAIRNKFTRIEYETDQYKAAGIRLEKFNTYMKIILGLSILAFSFVLLFYRQRSRNKQLVLQQEIEHEKTELYQLNLESQKKIDEVKNQERSRIAMELHDGVLSSISSIRISLSYLARKLKKKGLDTDEFKQYDSTIIQLSDDIRNLSHRLNETQEKQFDFIALLKNLLKSTDELNIDIVDDNKIQWEQINDNIKINLLRSIQECYTNAIKHSRASKFEVLFTLSDNILTTQIKDNGIGFNPHLKSKGIGLTNIKKRIEDILEGEYHIHSSSKGTKIKIVLYSVYDS